MKKRMEQVNIKIEKDSIVICQEGLGPGDDHKVFISPEQVDVVVRWLEEAKASFKAKAVKSA